MEKFNSKELEPSLEVRVKSPMDRIEAIRRKALNIVALSRENSQSHSEENLPPSTKGLTKSANKFNSFNIKDIKSPSLSPSTSKSGYYEVKNRFD